MDTQAEADLKAEYEEDYAMDSESYLEVGPPTTISPLCFRHVVLWLSLCVSLSSCFAVSLLCPETVGPERQPGAGGVHRRGGGGADGPVPCRRGESPRLLHHPRPLKPRLPHHPRPLKPGPHGRRCL